MNRFKIFRLNDISIDTGVVIQNFGDISDDILDNYGLSYAQVTYFSSGRWQTIEFARSIDVNESG